MRIRARFSKLGKIRFTSHRDVARMWERGLRKAGVAVAYTEGFSPRPRLSFGLALSTGHESLGEYLDIDLDAHAGLVDLEGFPARLDPALPVGITVQRAVEVEPGTPSLQQAVTCCTWSIEVIGSSEARVEAAVDAALAADSLVVTRTRKGHEVVDDLRPGIAALAVTGRTEDGVVLVADLGTQPRGLRPSELLAALAVVAAEPFAEGRVCRTHQWLLLDGEACEPIPVDLALAALPAPHAPVRAS
jgi:radical SAM-linked protein